MIGQDRAIVVALQALGWLVARDDLLPVFLAATGASPGDLRQQANEPAFLGAVLDFILQDDAAVMGFCTDAGLAYTVPLEARQALPGGGAVHWT